MRSFESLSSHRVTVTVAMSIFAISLVACGDAEVSQRQLEKKIDIAVSEAPSPPTNPGPLPVKEPETPPVPYNVHFDVNSAELSPAAAETLNMTVQYLREHPSMQVTLSGYTDAAGPADANKKLAEARVAEAARFLEDNGVVSTRIMTIAVGEAASDATPVGEDPQIWNRRVEVALSVSPSS